MVSEFYYLIVNFISIADYYSYYSLLLSLLLKPSLAFNISYYISLIRSNNIDINLIK